MSDLFSMYQKSGDIRRLDSFYRDVLCDVPVVRRSAPVPSPSDRWAEECIHLISTHVWSPEDTQHPKNTSLHNSHSILHGFTDGYCCEDGNTMAYDNWAAE